MALWADRLAKLAQALASTGKVPETSLSTAETVTTKVLAPDGAGGMAFRAEVGGSIDYALVYRTTTQTITTSTETAISFDAEVADAGGYHSTVTNPSRFTIPAGRAGIFIVGANWFYDNNATGQRQWYVKVNNTTIHSYMVDPGNAGFGTAKIIVSPPLNLVATDYVEVMTWQNSGGNRTVLNSPRAEAWIYRLGNA